MHSSVNSDGEGDKGGITAKQMRANNKLTLYQKGWQRMSEIARKGDQKRTKSLIDQQ